MATFLVGFLLGASYIGFSASDFQKPLDMLNSNTQKSSPSDRIKDYSVKVFDDRVVIYLRDAYIAKFADTHSMEPVLD